MVDRPDAAVTALRDVGPPLGRATSPVLDALRAQRAPARGRTSGVARPTHVALPSAAAPRVLLPVAHRRAAAAALRRTAGPSPTWPARARRDAAAAAARAGVLTRLAGDLLRLGPPHGGLPLQAHLSRVLGLDVEAMAITIGPPRPNAKPVVQLMRADGEVLAYAKVGWNPLTARLVDAEAVALQRISPAPGGVVEVPRLLHHGGWGGARIVATAALPHGRQAPARDLDPALRAALAEIFASAPTRRAPLRHSAWFDGLRAAAAASPAHRDVLVAAIEHVESAIGSAVVALGVQHGDFTPWNVGLRADAPTGSAVVAVWDFERCRTDAPAGLDALHYALEARRAAGGTWQQRLDAALPTARALGGEDADWDVAVPAHLLDLAVRHLSTDMAPADLRGDMVQALHTLHTWLQHR